MKQATFTTIILTAARGKYLTQVTSDIDIQDRVICTTIALGKNDSPDNWCEITADEANEFKRLKKEQ